MKIRCSTIKYVKQYILILYIKYVEQWEKLGYIAGEASNYRSYFT